MHLHDEQKQLFVVHHAPLTHGVLADCAILSLRTTNKLEDGKIELFAQDGTRVLVRLAESCRVDFAFSEIPAKIEVLEIYE